MFTYTKRLGQSRFVRNVAIVATGTAGAQVINMAFAPIITRLYGPEVFGVLGTFMAALAILTPLAALSYPIAIVLPKKDSDAVGLMKLSLGLAVAISLLVGLMLILFKKPIVYILNLSTIEPFIFLFPATILFSAYMAVASQWVIRKKLFKLKAKVAVLQSLWLNCAKAGLGFFNPVASGLVMLAALGSVLHATMLCVGIKRRQKYTAAEPTVEVEAVSYKTLAWRYRDFAYYRTPQIFLNAISQSMPVLMLASFFGPAQAGFYSLGRLVMAAPSAFVGGAVGDVFYPRIAEAARNGEGLTKLVVKATNVLMLVGVLPFGIVFILGPQLFSFVFGEEWYVAGEYARWLALWLFFMFANQPSIKALPVLSAQRFHLIFTVATISFRAIALVVGYWVFSNDVIAIALFGTVSMIINVFLIGWTVMLCYKFDRNNKVC